MCFLQNNHVTYEIYSQVDALVGKGGGAGNGKIFSTKLFCFRICVVLWIHNKYLKIYFVSECKCKSSLLLI